MKIEYSIWFNGRLYTPGQVGRYQVSTAEPVEDSMADPIYSYWDGNKWRGYSFHLSLVNANSPACFMQNRWFRGLARNPNLPQPTKHAA